MDEERCGAVYEAAREYLDRIEDAVHSFRSLVAGFYRENGDPLPPSLSDVEDTGEADDYGLGHSRDFILLMDDTVWLRDQISYAESEIGGRGDRISPFKHIPLSEGSIRAKEMGARLQRYYVQYDRLIARMRKVHRDLKDDGSLPYASVDREESVGGAGSLEDDILEPLTQEIEECLESFES